MSTYICSICGYVYDESAGNPEAGVTPGTKWEDVPEDWSCPLCGSSKDAFQEQVEKKTVPVPRTSEESKTVPVPDVSVVNENMPQIPDLSFGELSALCSNLSKASTKQYKTEEADLFDQLAVYYESKVSPAEENNLTGLLALVKQDLSSAYSTAKQVVGNHADRGALRALVWGEKVTRIVNSLIKRYDSQQDALLENENVYVCDVCGFVFIGDEPPDICPVCKAPKSKLIQIQRR